MKKSLKIALIIAKSANPKQMYKEYPLGIGYIGTVLKNANHIVRIFDQSIEFQDNTKLLKELLNFSPDVIGFSIMTSNYTNSIKILEMIKYNNLQSINFAGGVHPTLFAKECVEQGFDYVIKGEGEIASKQLVDAIFYTEDITKVSNIVYKSNNKIIENKTEKLNVDINSFPIVDRTLYSNEKYTKHSICTSRGCPFSCKFCFNFSNISTIKRGNRTRCIENVVSEIEYITSEFGNKEIFFTDDVFFNKISKVREFVELINKKRLSINFIAQLRADMITDEMCLLLKSIGCIKIEVGVETGSEIILKSACKGLSIEAIKRGIATAKKHNLRVKTNWIYGLPGSLSEQYKCIDLMLETKPNEISIHQLVPFPGTEYYEKREQYGIIIKDITNFDSFCYGTLDDNITYEYMSFDEYRQLLVDTIKALEKIGYKSSDNCTSDDMYIYSSPLEKRNLEIV
ncbi:MAG: hypothetical protein ATN36_04640 [Epulopiscium sp. Nele67-Bin005]|nr:MAG: hypothetical protein ATN36_04640 [Epulopiscium sp. Nele67-Bin005]